MRVCVSHPLAKWIKDKQACDLCLCASGGQTNTICPLPLICDLSMVTLILEDLLLGSVIIPHRHTHTHVRRRVYKRTKSSWDRNLMIQHWWPTQPWTLTSESVLCLAFKETKKWRLMWFKTSRGVWGVWVWSWVLPYAYQSSPDADRPRVARTHNTKPHMHLRSNLCMNSSEAHTSRHRLKLGKDGDAEWEWKEGSQTRLPAETLTGSKSNEHVVPPWK